MKALTDDEVVAQIEKLAVNTVVGTGFWYDEMERRQMMRSAERAERLTRQAVWLTVANLVVAAVAAVAAVVALAST